MDTNGRRNYNGDGNSFKTLFILSGSVVAIAVIAFLVTFITYNAKIEQSSRKESDISLARAENTISANVDIGKNVKELTNSIASIKNTIDSKNSNIIDTSKIDNNTKNNSVISSSNNVVNTNLSNSTN